MKNLFISGFLFFSLVGVMVLNPAWSDSPTGGSAFIEGEIALTPDPDRRGAYRYLKDGLDLGQYNRVLIMPIEVWIHPDSEYKGINPDDLKALADSFRQILVNELEPAFPVVDKAGPGTLVARLAISGVKLKKKKRGFWGYTPIGLAAGAVSGTYKKVTLKDVSIEAEILDANSGERLGVLVDSGIVESSKKATWEDVEMGLRFYGKRFRGRLDKAHSGSK